MKTIKNLTADEIRKSILQLAIQGKLVKQNYDDEPASVLVKRIYAEKEKLIKEGKIKKDKNESYIFKGDDNCYYEKIGKNEPVKLEDLPFDIPDNWTWIRLKNLCERIFSGKSPKYSQKITSNIAIGQASNNGSTIDLNHAKYCTDEFVINMPDFYYLKKNDVLLNTLGHGTLGRCGIYNLDNNDILTDGHLFIFRLFNDITSIFLHNYLFLNRKKIEKSSNGTTNQIFLSLSTVGEYLMPLPPLDEQQRIVNKINSFESLLRKYDLLEKELSKLELEFPEKLKKSILQYAIEGKLVKQDPDDEPASVLLERIKAEKEKLIKEGKIKRDKNESYIYQGDDKNYYENLPHNWIHTTYKKIILEIFGGGTPSKNEVSYWNGEIPWCSVKDLGSCLYIHKTIDSITFKGLKNSTSKIVKAGDFILCTRMAVGKVRIPLIDVAINQDLKGVIISKFINKKYFLYHILANQFLGTGTTVKGINQNDFINMRFLLPPINEQKRIVNKIETINQLLN